MDWTVNPNDDVPLYKQLLKSIREAIRVGELKPHAQLPSVRELAKKSNLNPNTVTKVLRELHVQGLVYPRRGMGVFVAGPEPLRVIGADVNTSSDLIDETLEDIDSMSQPIERDFEPTIVSILKTNSSPRDLLEKELIPQPTTACNQVAVKEREGLTASLDDERRPYLTIGQIEAARRNPPSVRADASVSEVRTRMLLDGVGHLPVLNGPRSAEGIISWESLARRLAGGEKPPVAREYMDPNVRVVGLDTALFDAVRDIIRTGAVLVRGRDNSICGLVTARDVAEQFLLLSEPFLFLEQIENHLRNLLVRAKLSQQQLRELVDPADGRCGEKPISIDDLTFGEYVRAMESVDIWNRMSLGIDRRLFTSHLQQVRRIRNAVMHFHPDGITKEDRELLARTRAMLQGL